MVIETGVAIHERNCFERGGPKRASPCVYLGFTSEVAI